MPRVSSMVVRALVRESKQATTFLCSNQHDFRLDKVPCHGNVSTYFFLTSDVSTLSALCQTYEDSCLENEDAAIFTESTKVK